MRISYVIAAVSAAMLISGCSKSSKPHPEVTVPTNAADYLAAVGTNTLEALQAKTEDNEKLIRKSQTTLDELRKSRGTNDQAYLDEQHKLEQILKFQRTLLLVIASEEINAQITNKNQSGQH